MHFYGGPVLPRQFYVGTVGLVHPRQVLRPYEEMTEFVKQEVASKSASLASKWPMKEARVPVLPRCRLRGAFDVPRRVLKVLLMLILQQKVPRISKLYYLAITHVVA